MRAITGKSAAVLVALLVLAVGGVLVVLRPWAGDDVPPDGRETVPDTSGTTVLAAGDIGRCEGKHDEATAEIVEQYPDATVLALGDLAYDDGSVEDFERCYDSSWGPFKERTRPAPGNHEYRTDGAAPYFDYFGSRAGEPGKGWYSFDVGDWHLVALNSNCTDVGCDVGSEQESWLRSDLEANDARCTLAFWHHPRFSSGAKHGGTKSVRHLWQALLEHDADVVLASHEHLYERSAPLDAKGRVDPEEGIRQFIVGTGGGNFYQLDDRIPGSEAAIVETAGLLRLTLHPTGYDWAFVPVGDGETDAGTGECH